MGNIPKRNRCNFKFHIPSHAGFDLVGDVVQNALRNRDPRWGITQNIALDNPGVQFGAIHVAAGTIGRMACYAAGASALAALRASSRATSFIIGDGAVWAFF